VVVVDIRNTGGAEITPNEFDEPLAFDLSPRLILNARVSEPPDEPTRELVRDGMEFFVPAAAAPPLPPPPAAGPQPPDTGSGLGALRELVSRRLASPRSPRPRLTWRAVRLRAVRLGRRRRFKLVLVLVEPTEAGSPVEIHRGVRRIGGKLRGGTIRDGGAERRFTLRRVTGVAAGVLVVLLLVGRVTVPTVGMPTTGCASGRARVTGSTVFMPTLRALADRYQRACPDATILTEATGSVNGVRAVVDAAPDQVDAMAAVADGKQDRVGAGLYSRQLAVVVYDVVGNSSAGVDGLSTDQLRGIKEYLYPIFRAVLNTVRK
jgi:hypothetical protein